MATNRDLLKEAIADAKAVKETAIANAKLALEEAFTPHLKSMLAAKLEEMDKDEDVKEGYGKKYEEDDVKKEAMHSKDKDKMDEEKEEVDEMDAPSFRRKNSPSYNFDADGGPVNPVPHKAGKSTVQEEKEEMDEEIDLDELLAELDEAKEEMSDADKKEIDREADAIRDDADQISKLAKDAGEDAADIKKKVDDDRAIDAVKDDMDQISKLAKDAGEDAKDVKVSEAKEDDKEDVKEAKHEDDKMEEAMKADDKDDVKEDARTDAEEEGYLDGMKDEKEDMEDDMRDEEIDLEDMSEDDLKGFIEDVIKDMVSAGEIEPGDEFVEDEVDVEDVDVEVEIDEMAHKDDEVKEEKEEMDEGHSRVKGEYGVGNEDGDRDDSKIEKETERMRFKEAMEEIQSLKEELSEVNLLNAKLLYTNKIFKAKNLTESKKVKVLKAFDKAKDVRQAKTIYETLSDGLLDKSKSPVNESVKGSASKATGIEPKAQKQPIIESNDVYNRMRKLAGLI